VTEPGFYNLVSCFLLFILAGIICLFFSVLLCYLVFRLHQIREMQTIVIDDPGVCLSRGWAGKDV